MKKCCDKQTPRKRNDEFNTIFCYECFQILSYDKKVTGEKERVRKKTAESGGEKIRLDRKALKQEADIKSIYSVRAVKAEETHDWLLNKHYTKRLPGIRYAFGLFNKSGTMEGVCTFGQPVTHYFNHGGVIFDDKVKVDMMELNRLCVNDGMPKNTLSYFISRCLDMLPKPICVVSYADLNNNHHGYIYQATNWIYTGLSEPVEMYFDEKKKQMFHNLTITKQYKKKSLIPKHIKEIKEEGGKHRYFKLLGDKKQVKLLQDNFKYPTLPYPKGENKRYDSSYKVKSTQMQMFSEE